MTVANKLSPAFVRAAKHTGKTRSAERHSDGNGLMLCIQPSGTRSWVQRIVIHGRRRTFGLGGYPLVSLKAARQMAHENRALARQGGDPLALRERHDIPDFTTAAGKVIDIQAGSWKDAGKSRRQWESSLATYAFPMLGTKRVDKITSADVMAAVLPIWTGKRETASRVRQRISAVMKWSVAQGYRGDDPAGPAVLQALPRGDGKPKRHHRALPHTEVAAALSTVRASGAWPATKLAFEFIVLTACRSGEVRGATWSEMDGDAWTIPAERMKAKTEHRVPLSRQALAVLEKARAIPRTAASADLVFPSTQGRVMGDNVISKLLRTLGIAAVPHGFRSSFRDWGAERTNTPHAVMEAALAHTIRNQAEAAYARSDLFGKRRTLMERWAAYIDDKPGEVVAIGEGRPRASQGDCIWESLVGYVAKQPPAGADFTSKMPEMGLTRRF